jgi:hypothetical protein
MRWLLWRELTLMTRTPALWFAMATQVILLTWLIVVWGDGVPVLSGSFFDQFSLVHASVLVFTLPWVAARCSEGSSRHFALLAAITATRARTIVVARGIALFAVLAATVASTGPMIVVALRIAGLDLAAAAGPLALSVAMCAFVSSLVTTALLFGVSRLPAWAIVTIVTAALARISDHAFAQTLLVVTVIVAGFAARAADQRLRYLS